MSHFLYATRKEPDGKLHLSLGQWFSETDMRQAITNKLTLPGLINLEYRQHDDYGLCHQEYIRPDGTSHLVALEVQA